VLLAVVLSDTSGGALDSAAVAVACTLQPRFDSCLLLGAHACRPCALRSVGAAIKADIGPDDDGSMPRKHHISGLRPPLAMPRKMIIDTDPGVDDALAIFMAFNSPEVRETYRRNCCVLCLGGCKSSRV
jgi:hypothetical protein